MEMWKRFAVAVVLGAIGVSSGYAQTTQAAPIPTIPSDTIDPVPSPPGRYQIIFSPHLERDTFLLDTSTGRVWQLTVFSQLVGEPATWEFMPRLDNEQQRYDFEQATTWKQDKKK